MTDTQRTARRIVAGITAIFSSQFIAIAENLAIVPIYLAYWSPAKYGEWLALSALVGYLSTLDLGMNMAGSNRLTQLHAKGDLPGYRRYFRAALAFNVGMAGVGTVFLGFAVVVLPIQDLLRLQHTSPMDVRVVAFLLGLQTLWTLPSGLVMSVYRTTGDVAATQWIRNGTTIIGIALAAGCLLFGGGMVTMAIIELATMLLVTAAVITHICVKMPELRPSILGAETALIRELVRPSLYFALIFLSEAVRMQGPILILSRFVGGSSVTLFGVSRTLCSAARTVAGAMCNSFIPKVAELDALDGRDGLRRLHRTLVNAGVALSVGVAAAMWFEGVDVVRIWTHGRMVADPWLLRLLLAQVVLQAPWQASAMITSAVNKHSSLSRYNIYSSVAGILISLALVGWLGALAIPVGAIFGEALFSYHLICADTCMRIGEPYLPFAARQWAFLGLASGISLLAAWGMSVAAVGPSPFRWAEVGIASSTAAIAVLWTAGLGVSERTMIKGLAGVVRAR